MKLNVKESLFSKGNGLFCCALSDLPAEVPLTGRRWERSSSDLAYEALAY